MKNSNIISTPNKQKKRKRNHDRSSDSSFEDSTPSDSTSSSSGESREKKKKKKKEKKRKHKKHKHKKSKKKKVVTNDLFSNVTIVQKDKSCEITKPNDRIKQDQSLSLMEEQKKDSSLQAQSRSFAPMTKG